MNNTNNYNPRKRQRSLLLSTSKNVSSSTSGPTVRPASVVRLESLLDRQQKKQKKDVSTGRSCNRHTNFTEKDKTTATAVATTTAKGTNVASSCQQQQRRTKNGDVRRKDVLANITTFRALNDRNVISGGSNSNLKQKYRKIQRRSSQQRSSLGSVQFTVNVAPVISSSQRHDNADSKNSNLTQRSVPVNVLTKTKPIHVTKQTAPISLNLSNKTNTTKQSRPIRPAFLVPPLAPVVTKPNLQLVSVLEKGTDRSDQSQSAVGVTPSHTKFGSTYNTANTTTRTGLSNRQTLNNVKNSNRSIRQKGNDSNATFPADNDNFVRLNLKNNAGACRGARNKHKRFKRRMRNDTGPERASNGHDDRTYDPHRKDHTDSRLATHDNDDAEEVSASSGYRIGKNESCGNTAYVSKMTGLDPMDEFLDGRYHSTNGDSKSTRRKDEPNEPKCPRHHRPCKLVVVKKNTTGNKGRKFFACSMPRGEQCGYFQWADDTVEATRDTISKNTHHSSFISRQVAAHIQRFRTLTVPELQKEATRRNLNKIGKKQQLLMRLAIWTREEIVKSAPHLEQEETDSSISTGKDEECTEMSESALLSLESSDTSDDDDNLSVESDLSQLQLCAKNEVDESAPKDSPTGLRQNANQDSINSSLFTIFGHKSFRNGQEWAVKRCLEGKKSLLVAPTGLGKSLCYALPAALMDGVCIVVSPLISLIQDQLRALPPRIPAATLSGSVSASTTAAILDDIVRKRLKILFVSPERLTSPAFRRLFLPSWDPEKKIQRRKFPEVSLLCIDEAHCISQWAHNFRPCFLRFKSLVSLVMPKSILAITATAGPRVIKDITETLEINSSSFSKKMFSELHNESVKIVNSARDNIDVKVKFMETQEERLSTLVGILTPYSSSGKNDAGNEIYAGVLAKGSVIVYVWRQRDTEVVAEYLNGAGVTGGVVIYHGGMDSNSRAKSQSKFMRGKARVCVATVAFGLGIDKSDVVGVVHLYLSNSPEHYIQEIGRAGRDGRQATAIALPLLEEIPIRHSLSHSNVVVKIQIESMLAQVKNLAEEAAKAIGKTLSGVNRCMHIALPVQASSFHCDCKQETLETFLSLIETTGGISPLIQVEGINYDSATVAMKKRSLEKLAEKEEVANAILELSSCVEPPLHDQQLGTSSSQPSSFQSQFLAYSMGVHAFSISNVANLLGETAEPRHVFAALRRLQSANELELSLDTSEKGKIFHLKITESGCHIFGNEDEYKAFEHRLSSSIHTTFSSSSSASAAKVLDMHYILDQVASASKPTDDNHAEKSLKSSSLNRFQELTSSFFSEGLTQERLGSKSTKLPQSFHETHKKELEADTYSLLQDLPQLQNTYRMNDGSDPLLFGRDADYTSLSITKFLHGIESPRTPTLLCRNHPLFGKWRHVDFELVVRDIRTTLEGWILGKKYGQTQVCAKRNHVDSAI